MEKITLLSRRPSFLPLPEYLLLFAPLDRVNSGDLFYEIIGETPHRYSNGRMDQQPLRRDLHCHRRFRLDPQAFPELLRDGYLPPLADNSGYHRLPPYLFASHVRLLQISSFVIPEVFNRESIRAFSWIPAKILPE